MSRFAEVIVLARDAEKVMQHLTVPDDGREWHQCFTPVDDSVFEGRHHGSSDCYMWVIQFYRHNWTGLLGYLESLNWPDPFSVQVLVRDQDDSCFGLWMIYDGKLSEVPLPRTRRTEFKFSVTGFLSRTDDPSSNPIS
ncbi:hypothetical protein [Nocardia sp. NBC_01327]|uniref:hypothetical protein n=1 Tax=Nocardia sp. NBC_01327 TaxID=2903593 RepID=UPI002E111EE7|nr:hypothetical protein OG326_33010 [Nocardia sp. NBC_01327]